MAASVGGLEAVSRVLSALPAHFPAAIVVVQHRVARWDHLTSDLLARRTQLPVRPAAAGAELPCGAVTVAPAGQQLLIGSDRRLVLTATSIEQGSTQRCAADRLFASAADVHGSRAIAVVLSGRLADGAAGARAIKTRGGRVLVQDPATAEAADMPLATMATGCVDFVLPPERIGVALSALVMAPGAAELFQVPVPPWARLA